MNTVYKWPLDLTDVQEVAIPEGTRCLHVGEQNGVLTLWGWCDSDEPLRDRRIAVVGTGNPAPSSREANHLGTVVMPNGFVWHVFEAVELI
jgi:hypothetical protein